MDYTKIITIEPGKRSGKPCIRGMRITVYDVLDYLASGMSEEEILSDFPDLTREDIRACLSFAADRERKLMSVSSERVKSLHDACALRFNHSKSSVITTACSDASLREFSNINDRLVNPNDPASNIVTVKKQNPTCFKFLRSSSRLSTSFNVRIVYLL